MSNLTVTKSQVLTSVGRFVKDRAKSVISYTAMVLNLAVAIQKELYLNEDGNPIGSKKLVSDKVPEGIDGASQSTVHRYVQGCIAFVESPHNFTRKELESVPPRAYHLCRPLVDGLDTDTVLTRKQILGHMRDKAIQNETIQKALGRKVETPTPTPTPNQSDPEKPSMPIVQLSNAVSAHRKESETDAGITDQDAVVTNIKQLYGMLDKDHKVSLVEYFTSLARVEKPKAKAKATPKKRTSRSRKTA